MTGAGGWLTQALNVVNAEAGTSPSLRLRQTLMESLCYSVQYEPARLAEVLTAAPTVGG